MSLFMLFLNLFSRKDNKMLEHEMEAVVFSKSTLAVTDPGFFCEGFANSQVRCAKHIILQNVWSVILSITFLKVLK